MINLEVALLFYIMGNFVLMGAGAAEFSCGEGLKVTLGKILLPGWILGFYLMKLFSIEIGNKK